MMTITQYMEITGSAKIKQVPYNERQWGHWLARNLINTKQKL